MKKIIVLLFAAVAVFGLTSCSSKSTPSDTVKSYLEALQKGDFDKALKLTTSADSEETQKEVEKMKGLNLKVTEFEILSETVSEDGESAVVETKYSFTTSFNQEPDSTTKKFRLIKKDGKWLIND